MAGLLEIGIEGRARLLAEDSIETHFDIERHPFARGKFAAVRRVFRKDDSSTFAAKYVKKRRRVSAEEIWHEVCILWKSRDCPFIVHLYQVFETALDTVLILEMAEDGDLQTLLDKQVFLEENLVVDILKDTLKGLHYLHSHSVAHLDIKPSNLLVVRGAPPQGRVKICDFGLSRHISNTSEVRELFGTVDYLSPEVLNYEPLSLAADCWAIGVLTYVLLSGVVPFGSDSKQETYLNISTANYSFPRKHFNHVSIFAIDFIRRLLMIQTTDRLTAEESLGHDFLNVEGVRKTFAEPNNNRDRRSSKGVVVDLEEDDDLDIPVPSPPLPLLIQD